MNAPAFTRSPSLESPMVIETMDGACRIHGLTTYSELYEALRIAAPFICRAECDNEIDWHSAKCDEARAALAKVGGES